MDVFKDERFKNIGRDPKFRRIPRNENKIKVDKRFQAMFTDDKFKLKYSVDQRGRPIKHTQVEDLKKYYDLTDGESENEEDDDKNETDKKSSSDEEPHDEEERKDDLPPENDNTTELITPSNLERSKMSEKILDRLQDTDVDYARGEGLLDTDSSSSDEPTTEDSDSEIEHDWGELDKNADVTDDATNRLAVCHMDWDRVTATDIMVLLHSFLPATGYIESVTIYPSDFGTKRMLEEEIKGPQELITKTLQVNSDDGQSSDEEDEYHREKLRQYQMKRLKYYYAVVVFDSEESANKVYSECDKMEYESSATRLDLRFIPDDMTFDQEPKEVCTSLPEAGKYKPRLFSNSALQQEKVELTWDETDPNRLDLTRRLAQGGSVTESDFKAYIATSSEESADEQSSQDEDQNDDNEVKEKHGNKEDEISKYRSLLAGIERDETAKKKGKVEMEISWDLALENRTKVVEQEKLNRKLTPFEQMIKKKKEKSKSNRKEKTSDNLLSDDEDLPSDVDMNDPFFKDELVNYPKKKSNKNKKKSSKWSVEDADDVDDEEETQRKAELELLLADDVEKDTNRRHFSLKTIQENEANKKKKKNKGKATKQNSYQEDSFKIDLKDGRFNALFTSHHYNVDPADSHFRKTKAMDDIIAEKNKRRKMDSKHRGLSQTKKSHQETPQLSDEVNQLLTSVKRKTKNKLV